MSTLERLSDQLYLLEHELDGTKVRGAVVIGQEKTLIFDTLIYPQHMLRALEVSQGREIIVVYSHADWDHVWGTCSLPFTDVIAHKRCAERFADPNDVANDLKDYQKKYPGLLDDITLIAPTKTFEDRLELDLGKLSIELTYLPGHTRDGIVAYCPELSVFLAGDALETPLPLIYEDSPLSRWIAELKIWQACENLTTVIPSHGSTGGKALIDHNVAYLKAMKAGLAFPIAQELDAFYLEAHARNQKISPMLR